MNPFPDKAPARTQPVLNFYQRSCHDDFSPPRNRQGNPRWLRNDRDLRASLFRLEWRAETRQLTQRFDPCLHDISKPAVKQEGALMDGVSFQDGHYKNESMERCHSNQAEDSKLFRRFNLRFSSFDWRSKHMANCVDDQAPFTPRVLPPFKYRFSSDAIVDRRTEALFCFGVVSNQQKCKQVQGPQILSKNPAEVSARGIPRTGWRRMVG
jgi:hypothetical protein